MTVFRKSMVLRVSAVALAVGVSTNVLAAKDPIQIGIPTSLTGPYSQLGEEVKQVVEFAVKEANAAGGVDGREVKVRFLDTEGKPDVARQQAEKLARDGYNILAASIASSEVLAIGPMLNRWNAVYVATITKANDITGAQCQKRLFRVNRPDYSDGAVVQPWLATQPQAKWAIVGADYAWGRGSGETFKKAAAATGKTVVSENYPPLGANDYAAYIQKVVDSGADGLWLALAGRDAMTFARQAKQFGLFEKVNTSGVSFATDGTVGVLGDVFKGVQDIINYSAMLDTPANKKFVADFEAANSGAYPTNFQGETYVGMQVIFQAVTKAGSVKPADVATAMEGTTFETILGSQLMRKEDHQLIGANHSGVIEEVNGRLRPVIKFTVPAQEATPGPDPACRL